MKEGRPMPLNFWTLPDQALDDPDGAAGWGRLAVDAARRSAQAKRKKPRA
jgi:DNA transformation protein